jgi:hypothetical protein
MTEAKEPMAEGQPDNGPSPEKTEIPTETEAREGGDPTEKEAGGRSYSPGSD